MMKSWKRILAAVLATCMIFGDSSLIYAAESSKPIEEVSSEAGDETAITSSEMSEDIVVEAEEAISEKQEEVVLEENPQEEIPVVEEPQETEVLEEQIPQEEVLPEETEDVSTDINEIIVENSMEAMNSSGNELLKPSTPVTVNGGEGGIYFTQNFDVKVDTTDNYYLYVEGTPILEISNIQAYGENGRFDYSIKPKACYTFDIDAESIHDVVRGYLLSSDRTYRISIHGSVPAETEVRFYLGKSDIEPKVLEADSAIGEVVPSNSRAMFKISEATTKAGFLQLYNGKNTDMRIYSSANTFQGSCIPNERGMIATIAAGGKEYYIAVQAESDKDATLFWNYAESEPIAVDDKKVIEKSNEYVYRFYEFVPNEENDYLISAYPNPNYSNMYTSGYCYCWTHAVDNDGNVRAFHSSYLGKDYTTKYYGEDYTDESTNVYWRRYQYPEKCEKIYILAWAYPGANTEVLLKEIYHAPTLKAETQVIIEGKDTAYEYDKQYDFIASEDGCYYLKSDVFIVEDILVLNEETGEYEKNNVDISYALKYGASDVTDVVKYFNLKAGKTYRVRIKGNVLQEGASFTWTGNEEYIKATPLKLGETVSTLYNQIFEICTQESTLGQLSFTDWGFGKIQLYGNSYESLYKEVGNQGSPEAKKEYCIAAAGGSKIYAVVNSSSGSQLSWKPLVAQKITLDDEIKEVAEQDGLVYYEFTPEAEGDYQILAQGGSTKIIFIGKDGTIKESREEIQGEDGNTWIHLLNPETLEKVYIIVEASQGSQIKVIVKDTTKDDDNNGDLTTLIVDKRVYLKGGTDGLNVQSWYDFVPEKSGYYYIESDTIKDYSYAIFSEDTGKFDYSLKPKVRCVLKEDALETTDVITSHYFEKGESYKVWLYGKVPANKTVTFIWKECTGEDTAELLSLNGEVKKVAANEISIFKIEENTTTVGQIEVLGHDRVSISGDNYSGLGRGTTGHYEYVIPAVAGKTYYVALKPTTDATISWKSKEVNTINPGDRFDLQLEEDEDYKIECYEFVPDSTKEYDLFCGTLNKTIVAVDNSGNLQWYGKDYTGEDGKTWKKLPQMEDVEKFYILAMVDKGEAQTVELKEAGSSNKNDIKLNTFDQELNVPAGETVAVTYEGPYLGDFFIDKNGSIDFNAVYTDSFIEGPLEYEYFHNPVYAYSFTDTYDSSTTDTVKFTFTLTNHSTIDQNISIFNSSACVGDLTYHVGDWIPWAADIENERGSYVWYYRFRIDQTAVYYHDGIEWIIRESDGKRFDRDYGSANEILNIGETYIIKFASTEYFSIEPLRMLDCRWECGEQIEYNGKWYESSVYFFEPNIAGKYAGKNQNTIVWERIDETNEWVPMGFGMGEYQLGAYHTYLVKFDGPDVFAIKKDITVLDYDYYQALIQSGGSVTVEGSNVTINPGKDNFTFFEKILSFFGYCYYEKHYNDVLVEGNTYWRSKEGAFAASEYYKLMDGELISCEYEEVQEGDVVVIKYEPEIVWVDSMTVSADRTAIGMGETAKISVDAKAATEKYPLENPVFSYESSNPNVLTVDENGVVTAHKDGTATVTVAADVALRYAENCPDKIVKQQIKFTVSKKYQIHYENVSGIEGFLNPENPTEYYTSATTMLTAPTANEGYEFAGWYSDAKLTKKITSIAKGSTGDKTIYAKWDYKDYNIHYVLNGGQFDGNYPMTFTIEGGTDLVNPIRHGYKFMGWYTSESFEENTKVVSIASGRTEDLTLYAKWEWATEFSLKVNSENGVYTFPYNTATGAWGSVPISLSVESNPKGILIGSDSSLEIKLYKGEELIKTLDNTLELSSTDLEEPGDYRLEGTYTHPGQEPQKLIGTEFTIKFAKREYPVNKEITWSALSSVGSGLTFGDIKDELAQLMQPTDDNAFRNDLGEKSLEPVNITIRNAKKAIVNDVAKLASGTYTVTLDFGENERFFNDATATLKLSYGAISNAGVHYAALNGEETDDVGRKAGTTIAFEIQGGETTINSTPYTSAVIITPMLNTPWGVVPADELETVLNENGYGDYTVEVNATETASKSQLLNVESVKAGETVLAKVKLSADGQIAGKCNLTVTTTIKNGEDVVTTINSVIKNFTVVNGGVEAANKITLNLKKSEKNDSGEENYVNVPEYPVGGNTAEDGVKTYLIEMTDTARKYKVDWTAYNYAGDAFAANLTWKSDNSKVASVKAEKDGSVFLTVPKNAQGVVEITATAKDAGKKSQSIKLVIVDTSMRLDTTSLTMNSLKKDESAIAYLYPNVLASVLGETNIDALFTNDTVKIYEKVKVGKDYIYNESNIFDSDYNVSSGELTVSFKDAQKKASTYTVYVGIKHGDEQIPSELHPLKIKDTCALPKAPSLKVTKSYETTYVDGYAELELVTYGAVGYVTDDVPDIQTTSGQKFEVFSWDMNYGIGGRTEWKLKVRAKEGFVDDILPTGKQSSKTTKGVKFEIGYEEYRTTHAVAANITATKTLPKLAVYGADSYAPVYYTDAGYRYVDVVIPVTDGMVADSIEDGAELATDGSSAYLQLTENVLTNDDEVPLKVTLKDTDKFTISSAKYVASYGSVPAKKGFTPVENAICLTVKVQESQTKAVSLQFDVESANLTDKITTGKLTINPRKIASESIALVNNNATVKSLTFNGALAGKESITLNAAMPTTMETLSEINDVQSRIVVEGSDSNGKKMLQSNALLLGVGTDAFTITSTNNSFNYTSCKLKVTMQTVTGTGTVNTKSTTLSLSFKKTLTPKITLSNVTLYRGLFKYFDEQENCTNYWPLGVTVKAKITNMPVGAEIIKVRFSDPADNAKYYEPFFYGTSGTFYLEQRNDVKLPLGKDTIGVVYDIRTASGTVVSVNSSFTVTVADKLSMMADVKSINLYNSAVGEQYGKDVTFYEGKTGFAVKVLDITNKEELEKAGISFNLDATSESEGRGQDTVRFYVDGNLTRGTEKTYTVKAKVALVDSVANDGENDTWNESTATEKIITFKIVLKK